MQSLKQAIEKGGLTACANKIGVTPQRLDNWLSRGVPVEMCATVEKTLGVSRKALRKKDWQTIWPELAN